MNNYTRLDHCRRITASDSWSQRLYGELDYAIKMADSGPQKLSEDISRELTRIEKSLTEQKVIPRALVLSVEKALSEYGSLLKKPVLHLCGHAHIDINWMWGWQETVSVTLETFRTVLRLMEEYPHFVYSQSQAALYRIVEEYEPQLLGRIGKRIQEGRWELTAPMWSESDMKMISAESLARHLLYSKQYLRQLFEVGDDAFQVAFLPDTFGHASMVPEILSCGGVKYYYHCRGAEDAHIYRWKAPSGASVLSFRETKWYNDPISPTIIATVPEFIRRYGFDQVLAVYGVGDHGGGPTRRDLERIQDMQNWPLAPTVRTSRYIDYFRLLDTQPGIPQLEGERGRIFTGCYSSQSRIKRANREAERQLYATELWQALSRIDGNGFQKREQQALSESWKRTLVSQFHDILPGSGTMDTREYALGEFQKTLAATIPLRTGYYRNLVEKQAPLTSQVLEENFSYGAGVGFHTELGRVPAVERGSGASRVVTLFNPLGYAIDAYPVITLWDWEVPKEQTSVELSDGTALPFQLLEEGENAYWHHSFTKLLLEVSLRPMSFTQVRIGRREQELPESEFHSYGVDGWLVEKPFEPVLENEFLRVVIDPASGQLTSIVDTRVNRELLSSGGAGIEYLLEMRDQKHMSSWVEGVFLKRKNPVSVRVLPSTYTRGELQHSCQVAYRFDSSEVVLTYRLNRNELALSCDAKVIWQEIGSEEKGIPRLRYTLQLDTTQGSCISDTMNGLQEIADSTLDHVGHSFCALEDHLMLTSRESYAYRWEEGALSLTLLRSSIDPDRFPEVGEHSFSFSIIPLTADRKGPDELAELSRVFCQPIEMLSTHIDSPVPAMNGLSWFEVSEGNVHITALKVSEKQDDLIVLRLYSLSKETQKVVLKTAFPLKAVWAADLHETRNESVAVTLSEDGKLIAWSQESLRTTTICMRLADGAL